MIFKVSKSGITS